MQVICTGALPNAVVQRMVLDASDLNLGVSSSLNFRIRNTSSSTFLRDIIITNPHLFDFRLMKISLLFNRNTFLTTKFNLMIIWMVIDNWWKNDNGHDDNYLRHHYLIVTHTFKWYIKWIKDHNGNRKIIGTSSHLSELVV